MARSPGPEPPPPGWYPDPRDALCERYWNGYQWTDETTPGLPEPWRYTGPQPRRNSLIVAGWATAFLFPLAGLVIGVSLARERNERDHGVAIVAVSAVVLLLLLVGVVLDAD